MMGENSGAGTSSSLVDESWELIDPCPDVHALFLQFNRQFFWEKLAGCEVRWSPKMTLCAGLCSYEGRGGLCSIRLSQPLLKLRPRKDLVETLLDHDAHGPSFHSHMHRINGRAGTRISVYHSFHAEVAVYKQHWWRCQGPCKDRKPYFGWLKRAMNRAPGSKDFWWSDHERTCGGEYIKVKEPEGYKDPKKKKNAEKTTQLPSTRKNKPVADGTGSSSSQKEITAFFGKGYVLGTGKPVGKEPKTENTASSKPVKPPVKDSAPVGDHPPRKRSKIDIVDLAAETVEPNDDSKTVPCPVCAVKLPLTEINGHLDACLATV